jgi:hypothetical protein
MPPVGPHFAPATTRDRRPDALTSDGKGLMVLVEAAGEPGHITMRFAATQRDALQSELEFWRESDIEGLKMVRI